MATLMQDVKYGLRLLVKNPGFTAVAVITLALGIGANTTIFSFAQAFLVHPISLPGIERLAVIAIGEKAPAAAADFLDWKAQSASFESMAAYRQSDINMSGGRVPERVLGSRVTSNFFGVLDVKPAMGRAFLGEEDQPGRDQAVVLSYGLWQRRFGADPNILGKVIELDSKSYTVAGVTAKDFDFPVPSDVWIPLAMDTKEKADRADRTIRVIGRLRPGVSAAQAQSEMATIGARLARDYPQTNKDRRVHVMPVVEFVEGQITRAYTFMLLVAVGFVLLIACSNIASLQLARSTTRQKEMAVRAALGASRWRGVRLLLTENVLLALLGGAASILLSTWILRLCTANMPAEIARLIPGWNQIHLDWRSLSYTFLIAIVSGMLGGLAPALEGSRIDLTEGLKEGARGSTGSRSHHGVRSLLAAGQIAVALVLLIGGGLIVKGFRKLVATQESYSPENMLTFQVNLPESRYANATKRELFYRQVLDKLGAMPGVTSAAVLTTTPISNNGTTWTPFQIEGRPVEDKAAMPFGVLQTISPSYFGAMRVPVMDGREFTEQDRDNAPAVAIVSQKLARVYWPNESALGKRIQIGNPALQGPWLTIVGIAGDVLYDWTDQRPEAAVYVPFAQAPPQDSLLGIRASAIPEGFEKDVQAQIARIDPELPIFEVKTLHEAIHESVVGLGYTADMMAGLGVIAFVIALVGVYGVMSYAVAERTHEIGVRLSLGAQRRDVLWLVSRRGLLLTLGGLAAGLPLSVWLAHLLSGLIYGTSALDPATFLAIPTLLVFVALLACYVPARRAMRVDPIVALRYE
ncbi:MAG TPA: ABC transporter permease [Candidatus Acidoferrum sp.]|nr:ABC transporter permease [Candidatus Acidoferrum sp.]